MSTYHYAANNPVMFNDPLGDQGGDYDQNPAERGASGINAVSFHGGYRRIGAGSGNNWADGINNGDWNAWTGSDSYRAAIAAGATDTGGELFLSGKQLKFNYLNGLYGYWEKQDMPTTKEKDGGSNLNTVNIFSKWIVVGDAIAAKYKDAVNWSATSLMIGGAVLEGAGERHAINLFLQGVRGGVSKNYTLKGRNLSLFGKAAMTSSTAPTSFLTTIGKGIGYGATLISAGSLIYDGYQFSRGEMDGGRLTYHAGAFVTSFGVGYAAGGPAGAVVGMGASAGEISYDISKDVIMTINGQFQNLINIHR